MHRLMAGFVTAAGFAALVGVAAAQVVALRGGAFVVVPHAAGDVYVPLDPSARPLFPAVPPAPPAPGTPPIPAIPASPESPGMPSQPGGGGYFVVPPGASDPAAPITGGGYHVVPRP